MSTPTVAATESQLPNKHKRVARAARNLSLSLVVAVFTYLYFKLGPPARYLDVTVSVVEINTGEPVPGAKVVIEAWDYGIDDEHPYYFLGSTDENGEYVFRRALPFAVSRAGAIVYDRKFTKKGVDGAETHLLDPWMFLKASPSPGPFTKYVHFYPNWRHFSVNLGEFTDTNPSRNEWEYRDIVDRADDTKRFIGQ